MCITGGRRHIDYRISLRIQKTQMKKKIVGSDKHKMRVIKCVQVFVRNKSILTQTQNQIHCKRRRIIIMNIYICMFYLKKKRK